MGLFSKDICDFCGNKVEKGVCPKTCGHWICCNCIVNRSSFKESSFFFSKQKELLCPVCGKRTGFKYDNLMIECRGH